MKGIIGVGNPFKGDDGIGVELVKEIENRGVPSGVKTFEVGSSTFDILHIMKDLDEVIIIDAVRFGADPAEHRFFTVQDVESLGDSETAHGTDILEILNLSENLGERPEKVLVMGIQPKETELSEEFSQPIKERLPELVEILQEKVKSFFTA